MSSSVIQFQPPKKPHLYIVDDFHVILAYSEEEAVQFVLEREPHEEQTLSVRTVDDEKELSIIRSGKVAVILWERKPYPFEKLITTITAKDFIYKDLKGQSIPSSQDIIEDRGATTPTK